MYVLQLLTKNAVDVIERVRDHRIPNGHVLYHQVETQPDGIGTWDVESESATHWHE